MASGNDFTSFKTAGHTPAKSGEPHETMLSSSFNAIMEDNADVISFILPIPEDLLSHINVGARINIISFPPHATMSPFSVSAINVVCVVKIF